MTNEKFILFKTKFVANIDISSIVESLSSVEFSSLKMEEYYDLFNQLKIAGVVLAQTFDDQVWRLVDQNNKRAKVTFDLDLYPYHNLALKCFTILCMKEREDPKNFQGKLLHIKKAILATQGFSDENAVEKLEVYFKRLSQSVLYKRTYAIAQYVVFSNHRFQEELVEVCHKFLPKNIQFRRQLPAFKDVLIFDSILTDFYDNCSEEVRLTYYPIYLWWRMTTVIPMRVSEFCSLANDCVFVNTNGDYLLKIPRIKQSSNTSSKLKVVDTLKINKELHDTIQEYKEMTRKFQSTPYLLSYKAYTQSARLRKTNGGALKNKINKDRFESQQLYSLLNAFYNEIICKKYGYENLEKLRPMDTRHYAFCNMMLQGFNMLSIAVIGGHSSLESQMHYFQHVEHFSQSSVQFWADQFRKFPTIAQTSEKPMLGGNERLLKIKSILNQFNEKDLRNLPKLEHGYCTFDPTRCPVGDCRYCEYFYIPHEEMNEDVYTWLNDESDHLKSRMKEQLSLMSQITQSMDYNLVSFEYDQQAQSELGYLSANTKKLIEQQSWIDARKKEIKEYLDGVDPRDEKSR